MNLFPIKMNRYRIKLSYRKVLKGKMSDRYLELIFFNLTPERKENILWNITTMISIRLTFIEQFTNQQLVFFGRIIHILNGGIRLIGITLLGVFVFWPSPTVLIYINVCYYIHYIYLLISIYFYFT